MYSSSDINLSRPAFEFLKQHRESGKTLDISGKEVPFLSYFEHDTGLIIYDVVRSIDAKVITPILTLGAIATEDDGVATTSFGSSSNSNGAAGAVVVVVAGFAGILIFGIIRLML